MCLPELTYLFCIHIESDMTLYANHAIILNIATGKEMTTLYELAHVQLF